MVEAKKQSRIIDTWKQKKWYKVNSPAMFGSRVVGETIAADESALIGRTLKTSLSAVTGDIKKQSASAVFEITEIKNGNAETILKQLVISPSSIRRMIRKGKDRIDLSILCATKDNVIVRVKPFMVTKAQIGGSLLTKMRNLLDALLRNEISRVNYETLTRDIIIGKLQKRAKQILGKIYPIKTSEIRSIEITTTDKPLPPIPPMPEIKEEVVELTEEEKIEKRMKQIEEEADKPKEVKEKVKKEEKPKKVKAKIEEIKAEAAA